MSKKRRIYILIAIAIPFAIAALISAWLEGYLDPYLIISGIAAVGWGIGLYNEAKKITRNQKIGEIKGASKVTHRRKRMLILIERTSYLFGLVIGIAFLVNSVVIWDFRVYSLLFAISLILFAGGSLFFIGPLTGD